MAANVVVIRDPAAWAILDFVFSELDRGGIVIGPDQAKELDEKFGENWEENTRMFLDDYDFGGEADLWVDLFNEVAREAVEKAVEEATASWPTDASL